MLIIMISMHLADTHFDPQDTFLLGHTVQSHTLLSRTFYSSTHFVIWIILLPNTFCFLLKHFAPHMQHSNPWNTLLPGTLYFKAWYSFSSVQGSKLFQEANCSRQQTVLGSKLFQGANSSRKQSVSGSKVFLRAKYICWRVKCVR